MESVFKQTIEMVMQTVNTQLAGVNTAIQNISCK